MAVGKRIAIVGTGLVGRAWAMVFSTHGFRVSLYDAKPGVAKAARGLVAKGLKELETHGLIDDPAGALARIRVAKTLVDALAGVVHVQENGPENVETKRAIFAELDKLAPKDAVIASSTSYIMASRFTEDLPGRARCLVGHPVNPPHLVPIVEISPAPWTDKKTIERARILYEKAGQVPILLKKEVEGFVVNRLQAVLLAEAFRIAGQGIASPQDIDKTIRDGLGLRWSFMGPFETIELNAPGGIPDYCARFQKSLDMMAEGATGGDPFGQKNLRAIMKEWGSNPSPSRMAQLSKWRDGRLATLKAHKRDAKRKPR